MDSDVRPASWRKPEVIRGVVNLTRSFAFLFKFKPSSIMVLVPIRFAKKCEKKKKYPMPQARPAGKGNQR